VSERDTEHRAAVIDRGMHTINGVTDVGPFLVRTMAELFHQTVRYR
jgi:hypothetical protein